MKDVGRDVYDSGQDYSYMSMITIMYDECSGFLNLFSDQFYNDLT